jgi:hypothetical protein
MIGVLLFLVILARSLVPAVGVLFLGWPADQVLVLFYLDTVLGIGAVMVALVYSMSREKAGAGWLARAKNLAGGIVGTLILLAFLAIFLGVPLVFMLANTDFSIAITLHNWSFQRSLELQALASAIWCATLLFQLRTQTPDELGFKALAGLIFFRWLIVVGVAFTGFPSLLGRFGPYFLILVYVGAAVFSEINPTRFLELMPGDKRMPGQRRPSRATTRE